MLYHIADKIEIPKHDFNPPAHEMYPGVTKASLTVLAVPTDFLNFPQNQKWGFLLATIPSLPGSPELALEAGEDAPLLLVLPHTCPGSVLPAEDEVGQRRCAAGFSPEAAGDAYGSLPT